DAGSYGRLQDKASSDVARGIVRGNMLAYASSGSSKMADSVVQAFADVSPDTMKGVRVVFIGAAADRDRVATAVPPSGVEFVFVEARSGIEAPLPPAVQARRRTARAGSTMTRWHCASTSSASTATSANRPARTTPFRRVKPST